MSDLNSQELAIWVACTTREDLMGKLMQTPPPQGDPDLIAAGIDVNDSKGKLLINALKGRLAGVAGAMGVFHSAMIQVLGGSYLPPKCPTTTQIKCIADLTCDTDTFDDQLNRRFTSLTLEKRSG